MTLTTVRYFSRCGLVWVRGEGITMTFRVKTMNEINEKLADFGYYAVQEWREDNGQLRGHTQHVSTRVAA